MRVPDTIAIELETAGDSRSTFRLRLDSTVVGGNLTAAQAQLLVADILERIALPNRNRIGRQIGAAEEELESRGGQMFCVATMTTTWRARLAAMSAPLANRASLWLICPALAGFASTTSTRKATAKEPSSKGCAGRSSLAPPWRPIGSVPATSRPGRRAARGRRRRGAQRGIKRDGRLRRRRPAPAQGSRAGVTGQDRCPGRAASVRSVSHRLCRDIGHGHWDWLRSLGLGQSEDVFRDNGVDGAVLPKLIADDVKEMGIVAVGHRGKIISAVEELNAASIARSDGVKSASLLSSIQLDAASCSSLIDARTPPAHRDVLRPRRLDRHVGHARSPGHPRDRRELSSRPCG